MLRPPWLPPCSPRAQRYAVRAYRKRSCRTTLVLTLAQRSWFLLAGFEELIQVREEVEETIKQVAGEHCVEPNIPVGTMIEPHVQLSCLRRLLSTQTSFLRY